jgi:hypothetical protein
MFPGQTIAPIATTYVGCEWFGEIFIEKEDACKCEWFAMCDHDATVLVLHPILGHVPACASCAERASQ